MAKFSIEKDLAVLRGLRAGGGAERVTRLGELLRGKNLHGLVVKMGAGLAEELGARELTAELVGVIEGLMEEGAAKRDPGCEGKTQALKVLVGWEVEAGELYMKAAGYQQMEASYSGTIDTAGEFRGTAAHGLVLTRAEGALLTVVDLLADREKAARQHAAIALGNWRGTEALPVLRLKAHVGDEDADTMGEVFAGLLRQDGEGQLDFVAGFLESRNLGVAEGAALAIGQSRLAGALEVLTKAWPGLRRTGIGSTVLMAIGLVRSEEAMGWLVDEMAGAGASGAREYVDALALYRGDSKLAAKLKAAVKRNPSLKEIVVGLMG